MKAICCDRARRVMPRNSTKTLTAVLLNFYVPGRLILALLNMSSVFVSLSSLYLIVFPRRRRSMNTYGLSTRPVTCHCQNTAINHLYTSLCFCFVLIDVLVALIYPSYSGVVFRYTYSLYMNATHMCLLGPVWSLNRVCSPFSQYISLFVGLAVTGHLLFLWSSFCVSIMTYPHREKNILGVA